MGGIRITGMNSGLDTEAIIAELVKAQRTKVDTYKKDQTKLEWKQDAWKDLNAKIKKFYESMDNLKFESDYKKKTTKISDADVASIITGAGAMTGVRKLIVDKLAQSGDLTSAKLNGNYNANTKLSQLGIDSDSTLTVKVNGQNKEIALNGNMTIGKLVEDLQGAGLNASFDAKNQRFFISSKESGAAANFELEFSDENAKHKLGFSERMSESEIQSYLAAYDYNESDVAARAQELADIYMGEISIAKNVISGYQTQQQKLIDENGYDSSKTVADLTQALQDLEADTTLTEEEKQAQKTALEEQLALAKEYENYNTKIAAQNDNITHFEEYVTVTEHGDGTTTATATANLTDQVRAKFDADKAYAQSVADTHRNSSSTNYATKMDGQDAVIRLNGAEFTSKSNTFEINGLTITVQKETNGDEVTLTTDEDIDGIYDKIKGFLKDYNTLINEMDKLYNAETAKGYEPLTEEEKEAMSESAVEKWEQKIKDSILRRDETLSTVSEAMKEMMLAGVEVNGKKMYLSDFGIETLGYFNSADNEKNAYHINGDPDDESTRYKDDLLRTAIANDTESVIGFFTGLSKNLSDKLYNLMGKTDYSSSFTVYEDVRMKEEYDAYTEKIKKQEAKVTALEDKWYAKFSAMETALAKMQSNQSAVTSLLGG